MFGGRAFFNIFRDSRTSLDSIRDKLVTLISFVIVQCPSIGTTWFGAGCGRNGVLADLRGREGGGVQIRNDTGTRQKEINFFFWI